MTQIKGWACFNKDEPLVPWSYTGATLLEDDIEIDITHCGVCGSDIHTLDSGWGPTIYPVIVGHEIIGKVKKLGSKVTDFKVGDRVGIGAQVEACLSEDCYECSIQQENMCKHAKWTYNNIRRRDGNVCYGGYAEKIIVQSRFVFKIPDSIPSEYAASLLCAGFTVFTPMLRYKFNSNHRIGIVGIGGLGHMAIMFGNALGCHVTAFSRSESKRNEAIQYGASNYVATSDSEQSKQVERSLDFLLITNTENLNWEQYVSWMKLEARIILLGIPEQDLSIPPFLLLLKNLSITGSLIGGSEQMKTMLKFAAKHKIRPVIERFPMSEVNHAVKYVRDGHIRYRAVLEN